MFRDDALVPEQIARLAAATPAAPALHDGRLTLSYGEFDARAAQVAAWLRGHGVAPETPVLLLAERGAEMAIGFLGILRSGGTAVLADPAHPARRLDRIAELTAPAAVLTLARLGHVPQTGGAPVLRLDADWATLPPADPATPAGPVHPDQLAYVVHTSGSTGDPKRVGVTHRSLAHSARTHRDGHRITPADRTAWLAPPGSSASAGELWPYLTTGAAVRAVPADVVADEHRLRDWLVEHRITTVFVSMPLAEHLYLAPWPAETALRLLTVGSDRVRRWPSGDLPFEVAVAYGSAEANGVTSCLVPYADRLTSATAGDTDRATAPPVGRPWPGVDVRLCDPELRAVADGEIGEICVAGPELARGYLGAPGATADRFRPDPQGPPGSRLYRTGDLGRWRADGRLEHHGRIDLDVKIRGVRVDPAEVEAQLLTHPQVREAVVVAAESPGGEQALAAYVVGDPMSRTGPPRPEDLHAFLADRLPDPAVPAGWTLLDRLPLTPNRKIDRRRLPPADWSALRAAGGAAPADDTERQIADIWAEVLGTAGIGRDDHFFRIGGTSLSAARILTRLRGRLGMRVRMRDLLRHPTVADLAALHRAGAGR